MYLCVIIYDNDAKIILEAFKETSINIYVASLRLRVRSN